MTAIALEKRPYMVRDRYGDEVCSVATITDVLKVLKARRDQGLSGDDVINTDRCDGGGGDDGQGFTTGLTADERELLDEAGY